MSERVFTTIYDTAEEIQKYSKYPFAEGQTFFATDIKKFYKDKDGHRRIQLQFESIEIFDGNIDEFFQNGTEGFEGEVVIANSPSGFKLYYVDTHGELHLLTYSPEQLVEISSSVTTDGIDGFNSFILNFYKLTDVQDSSISSLTPPENVQGTINFSTNTITGLSYTDSNVWFTDIADLDGEWTYDSNLSEWKFNNSALPESLDPTKVKIVVSQVLLFSQTTIYNFSGITGDNPSKFREDGSNQASLFLYQATSGTKPTVFPGELVYDFITKDFISGSLNNWSLNLPTLDAVTNRVIWTIGTAINSNIRLSVIASAEWGTTAANIKEFARYADDGENARNVFLTANKSLTITYNSSGTSPNPSGTIIFTATSQNFDNAEYSFNGGAFSSTNTFSYSIPANISSLTPAVNINVIAREVSDNSIQATDQKTVSAVRPGANGGTGPDGKKAIAGIVYFQNLSADAPATPSATNYDIADNSFTGLTQDWDLSSPTFQAGNNNKYWYSRFSGIEGNTTNIVDSLTFTTPESAINFEGLVTFTDTGQPLSLENTNVTSIEGGLLKTSVIESNATYTENNQQVPRLEINFDEGSITAQNFSIDSSGNASFAGTVTATAGDIGNWNIDNWLISENALISQELIRISDGTLNGTETERMTLDTGALSLSSYGQTRFTLDLERFTLKLSSETNSSSPFTIENSTTGALVLKANGINHTQTTDQYLTIDQFGVLGISAGSGGGTGTVTSVAAGNGMDFTTITSTGTVTMGTPGTLSSTTTNGTTATSHTHAITNYSLSGTSNQITVTGAGKVLGAATTLSLPQDIHTSAEPQFAGLGIGTSAPAQSIETVGGTGNAIQIRSNNTVPGTNSFLRLANSTINTAVQGSVELVATRTNEVDSGDAEFTINVAVGSTSKEMLRISNSKGVRLGTDSYISKDVGNITLLNRDINGNINLSAGSSGRINLNSKVIFDSVNYGTAAPSGTGIEGQIYYQHD